MEKSSIDIWILIMLILMKNMMNFLYTNASTVCCIDISRMLPTIFENLWESHTHRHKYISAFYYKRHFCHDSYRQIYEECNKSIERPWVFLWALWELCGYLWSMFHYCRYSFENGNGMNHEKSMRSLESYNVDQGEFFDRIDASGGMEDEFIPLKERKSTRIHTGIQLCYWQSRAKNARVYMSRSSKW